MILSGAALLAPMQASAQMPGMRGGMMEAMRPAYNAGDVRIFTEVFSLTDDQRVITQVLLDDYNESYRAGAEIVRVQMEDAFREMRERGDREDWRAMANSMMAPLDAWRKKAEDMNRQLMDDFRATLTEAQVERWPTFERRMRRVKGIPDGQLSGERVDLIAVVESMGLAEHRDELAPILEAYEIQLDDALRQRETDMTRAEQDIREAIQAFDFDKGLNAIDRQARLRIRVRDTNDLFIQQVRATLPVELGDEFFAKAMEAGYSSIYRATHTQEVFAAAKALPDLDSGVLASIEMMEAQYRQRLASMNDRLVRATREHEPKQIQRQIRVMQARMNGERVETPEDPVRDLMRERSEMDQQVVEQIRPLLTVEQWAKMPRRTQRMNNEQQRGPGGITLPGGGNRGGQQPQQQGGGRGRGG